MQTTEEFPMFTYFYNKAGEGFTLLEIVLSIALIGILTASFLFAFRNFQVDNDLGAAVANIVQSTRRAQLLSKAVSEDSDWGVKVFADRVVIFKGESYAERDDSRDETIDFPSSFSISGTEEIVFKKFSGEPQATGKIILIAASGEIREMEIQAKGRLSY